MDIFFKSLIENVHSFVIWVDTFHSAMLRLVKTGINKANLFALGNLPEFPVEFIHLVHDALLVLSGGHLHDCNVGIWGCTLLCLLNELCQILRCLFAWNVPADVILACHEYDSIMFYVSCVGPQVVAHVLHCRSWMVSDSHECVAPQLLFIDGVEH